MSSYQTMRMQQTQQFMKSIG